MTDLFSPEAAEVDREIMRGVKPKEPGELVHLSEKAGVTCPSHPVTERKLARHIELYGPEGTEHVETI